MGPTRIGVSACLLFACQELIGADFDAAHTGSHGSAGSGGSSAAFQTGGSSTSRQTGGGQQENGGQRSMSSGGEQAGGRARVEGSGGVLFEAAGGAGGAGGDGSSGRTWSGGAGEGNSRGVPAGGRIAATTTTGGAGVTGGAGDRAGAGGADTAVVPGARGGSGGEGPGPVLYNPDWDLADVFPFCYTHQQSLEQLDLHASSSVTAYATSDLQTQLTLFAAVPLDQVVGVKWLYRDDPWTGWNCFDAVPEPGQLAGVVPLAGPQQVFITTRRGSLFSRRPTMNGWTQWQLFSRPSASALARDIAAWQGRFGPARLLIATSEGLYSSKWVSLEERGANVYDGWRLVSKQLFERVTLCGDSPVRGFALAGGELYDVSVDTEPPAIRRLEGSSTSELADLDCVSDRTGNLQLFVTSLNGALSSFDVTIQGGETSATLIKPRDSLPALASLSAVSRISGNPYLFATSLSGDVFLSVDGGFTWLGAANWPNSQ